MSSKLYLFLVTCAVIVGISSADIFKDFLKWDIMSAFSDGASDQKKEEILQREEDDSSVQNTCNCEKMVCDCCVDFNVSAIIDIGGPGCVSMKYISKEEGIMVNVSYGENVLHSQRITKQNQKGTCMPLLAYVAEICAKFSDLKETENGMVGCLNFEPTVFGEATSQYPVGCFHMDSNGMRVNNSLEKIDEDDKGDEEEDEENEEDEDDVTIQKPEEEASFIEVVNQTAQEGLEFISSLFGFDVNDKKPGRNTTLITTKNSSSTIISTTEESIRKKKNNKIKAIKSRKYSIHF